MQVYAPTTDAEEAEFERFYEDLEKEMATHSSVLAWRIPGTGSLVVCHWWGPTESDTTEVTQHEDLPEKAMAPHSSTLAWKIPWREEPGRLQSMGSQRVGHDWVTSLSLFTFMHWRRKWQPTPVFLPRESQGRGSRWAAVYGVTQSRTRLKQLSKQNSDSP